MKETIRYGKPRMTDLPKDLGRSIIHTIMTTPAADDTEAQKKASDIEERISAARKTKE